MWLVVSNLSAFGNSGGDYGGCGSGYDGRQEPRVIDWVNGSELWQSGLTLMLGVFVPGNLMGKGQRTSWEMQDI